MLRVGARVRAMQSQELHGFRGFWRGSASLGRSRSYYRGMKTNLPAQPRLICKRKGPKTWEGVRALYQAGWTASAVAERFGVGVANIYRRSAAEGWRKDDVPDEPEDWLHEIEPGDDEVVDVRVIARAAIGHAVKLVRMGQFGRAAAAAKAAEMIGRLVERLPDPAVLDVDRDAGEMDDLRRKILALAQASAEPDDKADARGAG